MLMLRRGTVVETEPLTVETGGERRRAWADTGLVGPVELGDDVLVNTVALELKLGSGGFDIVHANLSRGLQGESDTDAHVIKLNYSPLQHPVDPVEAGTGEYGFDQEVEGGTDVGSSAAVLVLPLHGHLAPAAFAISQTAPGLKVGFIQATGGALPGSFSRDVPELRRRGLLCGHVTAGPCYGGEIEAITLSGAIDAAAGQLGWDLILVGPGPGILGSATRLGHGGMAALDAAHTALALGLETVLSPRLSEGDPRPRHRGLSHHTATVLELLLAPVTVPVPAGEPEIASAVESIEPRAGHRHRVQPAEVDLDAYIASGLPRRTMGRDAEDDRLFFAAPLAAGCALARRRA